MFSKNWLALATSLLLVVAVPANAETVANAAAPEPGEAASAETPASGGFPAAARRHEHRSPKPLHLGVGAGVFEPWDGQRGFNVAGSLHVGLGSDRFWVGGEFEYRRFEADLKSNYRPDTNTWALRFSFQYHPFPAWVVSPYCGVQVGLALHKVDDNHARDDPSDKIRNDVSGGLTLVGLAGAQVPLFSQRVHLFAEGRLGNTSDVWKRKGGNYQSDQVDGVTGMGGLRFSF